MISLDSEIIQANTLVVETPTKGCVYTSYHYISVYFCDLLQIQYFSLLDRNVQEPLLTSINFLDSDCPDNADHQAVCIH